MPLGGITIAGTQNSLADLAQIFGHESAAHMIVPAWVPTFLDTIHEGILVVDHLGRIVYANTAYTRIFGVPVAKVLGRRLADIEPNAHILRVLASGKPVLHGYEEIQSARKRIQTNLTAIRNSDGKIIGAVATFVDAAEIGNEHDPDWPRRRAYALPKPDRIELIGQTPVWRQLLWEVARVAPADVTVLLEGESGSGKELVARTLHEESRRAHKPFVAISCAAIPETLLESELFGYEDGAFSGARPGGKTGRIELANGGTLLLDEIGEMPLTLQAKLLRVLQERKLDPIGGVQPKPVNIRVVSATHQDLSKMVSAGRFRMDLYYRLAVYKLRVPALRDRPDDIPDLVRHFVAKHHQIAGGTPGASPCFLRALREHSWPGNVRELENAVIHSLVRAEGSELTPEHLPDEITRSADRPTGAGARTDTLRDQLERTEREAIISALANAKGNRSQAIRTLGISRAAFYRRLHQYGLDP